MRTISTCLTAILVFAAVPGCSSGLFAGKSLSLPFFSSTDTGDSTDEPSGFSRQVGSARDSLDSELATIDDFVWGWITPEQEERFDTLISDGKTDVAYAWARRYARDNWDDARALNGLAWKIVDGTPADQQDLSLALTFSKRANELTRGRNAPILDTLARTCWEMGRTSEAVAWQEQALSHARNGETAAEIATTLYRYRTTLVNVDQP